jgi:hypothetical protein
MQLPLVPGVYSEQRPPRVSEAEPRTDVCGFVGFEPRVRDAGSAFIGDPLAGHRFAVRIARFQARLEAERIQVEAAGLVLSSSAIDPLLPDGGSIVYGVVAIAGEPAAVLRSFPGGVRPDRYARPPDDRVIDDLVDGRWLRLVDVAVHRVGMTARVTVIPRLPPMRCDDWETYQIFHGPFEEADSTLLARTVRAFFANGGTRCHVAVVRRPDPSDEIGLREAALAFAGVPGSSELEATGFERLLLIDEVALAAMPDLYARRALEGAEVVLPPGQTSACFRRCGPELAPVAARAPGAQGAPLFSDSLVLEVQRALMVRAGAERWRVQLLLSVPVEFDPAIGDYSSPSHPRALAWRAALTGATDDAASAATAVYHPWLLGADREGGLLLELPPDGFCAGVIARRDLRRGPAVAAANESVIGTVGPARRVTDEENGELYATPAHINVTRAFPGRGVLLWGARTQSTDARLRYLNVRRGLSAIERRVVAAFRPLVFEPNTPTLWFQMTQVALGVLLELFQQGALRGDTPEQAFYIRCDESNNPPEQIAVGRVVCEVGVAIAAPAEFVIFRISRDDALLAVEEVA